MNVVAIHIHSCYKKFSSISQEPCNSIYVITIELSKQKSSYQLV